MVTGFLIKCNHPFWRTTQWFDKSLLIKYVWPLTTHNTFLNYFLRYNSVREKNEQIYCSLQDSQLESSMTWRSGRAEGWHSISSQREQRHLFSPLYLTLWLAEMTRCPVTGTALTLHIWNNCERLLHTQACRRSLIHLLIIHSVCGLEWLSLLSTTKVKGQASSSLQSISYSSFRLVLLQPFETYPESESIGFWYVLVEVLILNPYSALCVLCRKVNRNTSHIHISLPVSYLSNRDKSRFVCSFTPVPYSPQHSVTERKPHVRGWGDIPTSTVLLLKIKK